MSDHVWTLHDASGAVLRTTERFASKEEAEAWMGSNWSALLDEGAESVSLLDGDEVVYEMGLRAE